MYNVPKIVLLVDPMLSFELLISFEIFRSFLDLIYVAFIEMASVFLYIFLRIFRY